MSDVVTVRTLIEDELRRREESWDDFVVFITARRYDDEDVGLDDEIDDGFGIYEGPLFLGWTKTRVYFPTEYDGSQMCDSLPRDPDLTEEIRYF